jgi:hypothetical protein
MKISCFAGIALVRVDFVELKTSARSSLLLQLFHNEFASFSRCVTILLVSFLVGFHR